MWDRIAFSVDGAAWAIAACLLASLSYGVAVNFTKSKLAGVPALMLVACAVIVVGIALATRPSLRGA
jgi:drug/metabolite transporter (DMT)-like permease